MQASLEDDDDVAVTYVGPETSHSVLQRLGKKCKLSMVVLECGETFQRQAPPHGRDSYRG